MRKVQVNAGKKKQAYFSDNWGNVPIPAEAHAAAQAAAQAAEGEEGAKDIVKEEIIKKEEDERVQRFLLLAFTMTFTLTVLWTVWEKGHGRVCQRMVFK